MQMGSLDGYLFVAVILNLLEGEVEKGNLHIGDMEKD